MKYNNIIITRDKSVKQKVCNSSAQTYLVSASVIFNEHFNF